MFTYNVKKAWDAYRKGNFNDALKLFNIVANKIGLHIFDANIKLIKEKLQNNNLKKDIKLEIQQNNINLDDFIKIYNVEPGCSYEITFEINKNTGNSHGIISIENLDKNKNYLPPSGNHPISKFFGCYEYIVKNGEFKQKIITNVANNARYILLKGKTTKQDKDIRLLSIPNLKKQSNIEVQICEKIIRIIDSIPEKEKCLLVSTTASSISTKNSLILRSARLAKYFSEQNWHVFYCPFNSKIDNNEIELNKNLIQIPRNILQSIIDAFFKRRGKNNIFLCSSFTDLFSIYCIDRFSHQNWKIIYEIRDDMEEFNRAGYSKWYDPSFEKRVAQRSDIIIATSPALYDRISAITSRSDIHLIPNAAPNELIENASFLRTEKIAKLRSKYKKIGYIGHLTESWFDWQWLIKSSTDNPDITIEIIGKGMPNNIVLPGNIKYLGEKNHQECLEYAKFWSAGIIPFIISRLTWGVSPNKAYEYIAMGLRIISAPMGQVYTMPSSYIYYNQKEMSLLIKKSVNKEISHEELLKINEYILNNSWNNRFNKILKILS